MIKRFYATKDNTITNAFEENLVTRGTGSNMGASDILEVFSIYAQASDVSKEKARILIQFDMEDISSKIGSEIPENGVSWYLNMFNAPHSQTVPSAFSLSVLAVSQYWEEGYGMDMDFYSDVTNDGTGSNWIQARHSASADDGLWVSEGGDYHASPTFDVEFKTGLEDLGCDVTTLVNEWLAGDKDNNGFIIKLSDSSEEEVRSFFTKKFFGRDSEFFFKRPVLEARWDDTRKDDRGNFFASSSLASAEDNLNTLYLYNSIRGRLKDIPSLGSNDIYVDLYDAAGGTKLNVDSFTGSAEATGIYKCDVFLETTASTIYDVWFSGSNQYHTGTIEVQQFSTQDYSDYGSYVLSMPGLKNEYKANQTHRLNLYVRQKNWSPNIYTTAVQKSIPSLLIESASYQIKRSIDQYVVVPYGTDAPFHTSLSYDATGNYLFLDTSYLEPGYLYEIQYSFYEENGWEEQPYKFKFRVVD